jgi:hypothetical protein
MGGLGIEMTTSEKSLLSYLEDCERKAQLVIKDMITAFGEQCVARVRDRSAQESWIDHTGNLRSSIGYSVLVDGKELERGGFKSTSAPEGNGSTGRSDGQKFIEKIIRLYHDNYVLVIVAGMSYADEVEAIESKDVLASTESWAREKWSRFLPELKKRLDKEFQLLEKKHRLS